MTTSTPPAWGWLDECYVPNAGTDHEYGQMREDALSMDARNLPESATLHAQNDSGTEPEVSSSTTRKLEPDPTGEDAWPLERAVSQTGNAPDTGNSAAPSHRIGTCYLDPDTGETVMPADFFGEKELRWKEDIGGGCKGDKLCRVHVECETTSPADSCVAKCPVCLHELENDEGVLCDHCGEPTGVESFAVVNGPGGVFVYHLRCYDEAYWGGLIPKRETGSAEETLDPALDTVQCCGVPFNVQEFMFEELAEEMVAQLPHLILTHSERIVEMARDRFRKGYAQHGSAMYSWTPERRLDETLQELADAVVYPTSGSISC